RRDGLYIRVQGASADDPFHWTLADHDLLAGPPAWLQAKENYWASHVVYRADAGVYLLYYSLQVKDGGRGQAEFGISVAVSENPLGPFHDQSSGPIVTGPDTRDIDPFVR